MTFVQDGIGGSNLLAVESNRASRSVIVPRGQQFIVSEITGTVAAALGGNSSVFLMRLDAGSSLRAFVDRVVLRYSTIVAYTTPVTAGRRLALFRGTSVVNASGGTAVATVAPKSTGFSASEFDAASGGDVRIASTGALTVTGFTFETSPLAVMTLVHVGAAGAYAEATFAFDSPIQLEPGQSLAVRNPAAMDAAGTWQLGVEVHWREAAQLL